MMDRSELVAYLDVGDRGLQRGLTMKEVAEHIQQEERDFERLPEVVRAKIVHEGGHWMWTGRTTRKGAPVVDIDRTVRTVRRVTFTKIEHSVHSDRRVVNTCGHPLCVHPRHAAEMTLSETGRAGAREPSAFCRRGHEMSGDNLLVSGGKRRCRSCRALRRQALKAER